MENDLRRPPVIQFQPIESLRVEVASLILIDEQLAPPAARSWILFAGSRQIVEPHSSDQQCPVYVRHRTLPICRCTWIGAVRSNRTEYTCAPHVPVDALAFGPMRISLAGTDPPKRIFFGFRRKLEFEHFNLQFENSIWKSCLHFSFGPSKQINATLRKRNLRKRSPRQTTPRKSPKQLNARKGIPSFNNHQDFG